MSWVPGSQFWTPQGLNVVEEVFTPATSDFGKFVIHSYPAIGALSNGDRTFNGTANAIVPGFPPPTFGVQLIDGIGGKPNGTVWAVEITITSSSGIQIYGDGYEDSYTSFEWLSNGDLYVSDNPQAPISSFSGSDVLGFVFYQGATASESGAVLFLNGTLITQIAGGFDVLTFEFGPNDYSGPSTVTGSCTCQCDLNSMVHKAAYVAFDSSVTSWPAP